jgi:hypothetical protein
MGHPSALDHPRALQVDRPGAKVVEQSHAAAERDGHQVQVDLVQESRADALLHDARGAHADVLVAGDRLRWCCCICCERVLSRQTVVMRTRRSRPAPVPRPAFAGFCFPPEVTVLAVRWYLRFSLSYRDVEELLAERWIEVDHVTVYRWG